VLLARLTTHTSFATLIVAYVLFGLGSGLINPPITNTAVSGMPPSQAGVAAAVASTCRQVGQTLGVAVLGAVAGGGTAGAIGSAFTAGTHAAWWIVVGLGAVILVLGATTTGRWARETAAATAERLTERGPRPAQEPRQPATVA
jgi:MFS family permease